VSAHRYVYDGVLEAQFIMVHDANKQLLGVADIYPGAYLVPLNLSPADTHCIGRLAMQCKLTTTTVC
jgi:Tripeptidyl peptidase II